MNQNIENLRPEEATDIETQRDWVRNHYEPEAVHNYDSIEGKLAVIDAILQNGWVAPTEIVKLQCLGVALGDALAQHLGLNWVAVEDQFGRDPALRFENTSVLTFPVTAISKRVEQGESVDIYDLFNGISEAIREAIKDCS